MKTDLLKIDQQGCFYLSISSGREPQRPQVSIILYISIMRNLCWLLLFPFTLLAQSYQLIDPNTIYLYEDLNYAIRIDSVETWARGYRYHNYRIAPLCGVPASNPNWFQQPLLVDTVSGRYTFFNDGGDSIHFETQTAAGDAWRMARLTDSTWLQARHDSTKQDTIFGQVDSVRYYHLQAVDSGGQLFYHPWNDSVLRLSRQHGLLTMVATDTFPYGPPRIFELQGMENPDLGAYRLTLRRLYSMPVGGEIHQVKEYSRDLTAYYSETFPHRVPEKEYYQQNILGREEWADSIKIQFKEIRIREWFVAYDQSLDSLGYEFDSSTYQYTLTVLDLDSMPLPSEFEPYVLGRRYGYRRVLKPTEIITRLASVWPANNPGSEIQLPVQFDLPLIVGKIGITFYDEWSCYGESIDVSSHVWGYEGLGLGYHGAGYSSFPYTRYSVYYAFPSDTGGTPINFDSLQQLVTSIPEPPSQAFEVYPNPFQTEIFLKGLPSAPHGVMAEVFDGVGRRVFASKWEGASLDLSFLPRGPYLLRLRSKERNWGYYRLIKR